MMVVVVIVLVVVNLACMLIRLTALRWLMLATSLVGEGLNYTGAPSTCTSRSVNL